MSIRRSLLLTLTTCLFSVFILEIALNITDPLGVVYYRDIRTMNAISKREDPSGYTFVPSRITHLTHWAYRTEADGTRAVPGSSQTGAPILFYGDSVTFGMGVNDSETWVSRVCSALHLNCINYGRGGYAASNTAALMQATAEGHCAVFLTIHNDIETMPEFRSGATNLRPMVLDYWYFFTVGRYGGYAPFDPDAYARAMEYVTSRPDTLLLAFDDNNYGKIVREKYGALIIPYFTSRISAADTHADSEGNRQIAESILPILDDWLKKRNCT